MKKYKVTRRRVVTQQAVIEITVEDDANPIEVGNAVFVTDWQDVSESALSSDVEPIEEEATDGVA